MMASKTSSTLPAQDDQSVTGGCLASDSSFYLVQSFLGQGTFGKVVKCLRMTDMKTVAIKMIKIHGSNVKQTNEEVGKKLGILSNMSCTIFVIMLCIVVPPTVFGEMPTDMCWLV